MNGISDRMDINQLLMQMREIRGQIQTPETAQPDLAQAVNQGKGLEGVSKADGTGFGDMLKSAVDSVANTQQKSGELQRAFEMGDPEVEIQMQKASVSFEAMNQVRNRLVSAYQDIMNMPI